MMVRIVISIPEQLKTKLDSLRLEGTTASGLIRHLLIQHFGPASTQAESRRDNQPLE
jgi:hypothetical protein